MFVILVDNMESKIFGFGLTLWGLYKGEDCFCVSGLLQNCSGWAWGQIPCDSSCVPKGMLFSM